MSDSAKGFGIFIAIVLFIVLLAQCGSDEPQSERNRVGSSINWGDDYYWDSKTESVQRTFSSYFH